MISLLLLVLAAPPETPRTKVCRASDPSKCANTTTVGGKEAVDVNVVQTVGGASSASSVYVLDAGVLNVNPVGITGQVSVNIADAGAPLNVNFPVTQAVSGIDAGALATDAQTALVAAELVNGAATVRVLNLPPAPARNPLTGAAKVDGSGAVQPVSAAALPLPSNAAQEDGGYLSMIAAALTAQSASQTSAVQFVVITQAPPPLNPFLLRCNPVRRTNCQP